MVLKRCIFFLLLVISIHTGSYAQALPTPAAIDVSLIKLSKNINFEAQWYADSTHLTTTNVFTGIDFKNRVPEALHDRISPRQVEKNFYLKFRLANSSDKPLTVYFLPGFYFRKIQLFEAGGDNKLEPLPDFANDPIGYKKIILSPHKNTLVMARLQFVKTTVNHFAPELIQNDYLPTFILDKQNADPDFKVILFVLTGVLLMMIVYSIAVYTLNRTVEFVYYAGYALCMAVIFFLKAYLYNTPSFFNYFFEAYLDFVIHSAGTYIYLVFIRKFLGTKTNFPFLHKMIIAELVLIPVSMLLFSYYYFYTDKFRLQDMVEGITKLMWLLSAIIFIMYTIFVRKKLLYFLAIGHFFLICGGLISLYFVKFTAGSFPAIMNNSVIDYAFGLAIELMFFMIALSFKSREDLIDRTKERERLKLQNERQEFEKQLAVFFAKQDERNRISADMHDELGSGVTAIRLMSEIVKAKMKENTLPEINRISNSANELINKMNTIIWTMKSENDSLVSLVTYIRTYALEFFDNTPINCTVNIPAYLPNLDLSGEKRQNIFLSVKESLNNILKHSKADKVAISFIITHKLIISIKDNGIGIDFDKLRQFGNGLSNIRKRIEGIDGKYTIENDNGALTTIELGV